MNHNAGGERASTIHTKTSRAITAYYPHVDKTGGVWRSSAAVAEAKYRYVGK